MSSERDAVIGGECGELLIVAFRFCADKISRRPILLTFAPGAGRQRCVRFAGWPASLKDLQGFLSDAAVDTSIGLYPGRGMDRSSARGLCIDLKCGSLR
jgi:hypothetical protein